MIVKESDIYKEYSEYFKKKHLSDFSPGRVTQEHRERYIVSDGKREYEAEITGNLRFTAKSRTDFPAVGDWVAMKIHDSDLAIIHEILPRKTVLKRQAVGKPGDSQIIAVNIDTAFIIQAINNNFNINRLERYLSICYSSNIEPVLVLSKTDLAGEEEIAASISELEKREKKVKYILLSNITLTGLDQFLGLMQRNMTYCVVGSSGVGKSTLINNLLKKNLLKTGQISSSTNKGKHTTDHRELFVLENGSIIIDTPGMKELGITDDQVGIRTTFEDIIDISAKCKFPDCRHINETGCAVIEALNKGIIERNSFENFQKIMKEQERFNTTLFEKRKKDKAFGKMLRNYKKNDRYKP